MFSSKTPCNIVGELPDGTIWDGLNLAQHNEPNLILTSIREGDHDVLSALDLLQDDAREWWTPIVTDDMIDHARRVLTPLARLS